MLLRRDVTADGCEELRSCNPAQRFVEQVSLVLTAGDEAQFLVAMCRGIVYACVYIILKSNAVVSFSTANS